MLKKMALVIVAASFLLIVTVPDQAFNHHSIQPQVQHGGA
ncbi:competence protein ComGC [Paenibacillus brasilensis]|uniref:Competence protein ComGC n=1 Tax=Paenibacillus brasilensis TaxID=128574 RepID=A0ABU0KTP9_9BACL|nr:competence protein ComGC [Paenibacillus brasilensis]